MKYIISLFLFAFLISPSQARNPHHQLQVVLANLMDNSTVGSEASDLYQEVGSPQVIYDCFLGMQPGKCSQMFWKDSQNYLHFHANLINYYSTPETNFYRTWIVTLALEQQKWGRTFKAFNNAMIIMTEISQSEDDFLKGDMALYGLSKPLAKANNLSLSDHYIYFSQGEDAYSNFLNL